MRDELWIGAAGLMAVAGLMAYAVFGGADFGGGVWDLFATGPRKREQREAIHQAMGPVWEANHVWLIFVIVVLFTCFPNGYSPLVTGLFLPLHVALVGIMLRGASFVFRAYGRVRPTLPGEAMHGAVWQTVFGVASLMTPWVLGAAFGAITGGQIRVTEGVVRFEHAAPWFTPYAIACGMLAVAACGYLAAVFLCVETEGELREDFRRRAIVGGTATAVLAGVTLLLAQMEAGWFFERLMGRAALPVVVAGLAAFAVSAWAVFARRYRVARVSAAAEVTLLLAGWAAAHYPYLMYPDVHLAMAAGPVTTVRFLVVAALAGLCLLVPSLAFLFRVFKMKEAGHD